MHLFSFRILFCEFLLDVVVKACSVVRPYILTEPSSQCHQKLRVFLCSLIKYRMCIINLIGKVSGHRIVLVAYRTLTEFSYMQPLTLILACVAMVARKGNSSENQRIYQPFEWTSKCSLSWAQCSDWWWCVLQGQDYTLLIQAPLRSSKVEQSTVCSLGKHIVVLIIFSSVIFVVFFLVRNMLYLVIRSKVIMSPWLD